MSCNGIPSSLQWDYTHQDVMEMSYITSTNEHTHTLCIHTHLHTPLTVYNYLETIERQ